MRFWIFLYRFLFGYYIISCDEKQRARALNFFLNEGIAAEPKGEDAWVIAARYKPLIEAASSKGIHFVIGDVFGLPRLLKRYRGRAGLAVGAAVAFLMLLWSGSVVWHIEVSGNESIPNEKIIAELAEIGFGEGAAIRSTDFPALANAYRLKHSEIAHMDIYCVGTTAYVKIQEAETPSRDEIQEAPANLIASRDAVIESLDVLHGTAEVTPGAVVKEGDLLVSGVVDGAHGSALLHAEGKVMGRITEEIVVEIPLATTKQHVKETKKVAFTVNFFGIPINIIKNTGNLPASYGTIVKEERWFLPSGKALPFSYTVQSAVLYENEEVALSGREALRLALAALKGKIASAVKDGYVISKTTKAFLDEDSCTVKCKLVYVGNIAEERAIGIVPS